MYFTKFKNLFKTNDELHPLRDAIGIQCIHIKRYWGHYKFENNDEVTELINKFSEWDQYKIRLNSDREILDFLLSISQRLDEIADEACCDVISDQHF